MTEFDKLGHLFPPCRSIPLKQFAACGVQGWRIGVFLILDFRFRILDLINDQIAEDQLAAVTIDSAELVAGRNPKSKINVLYFYSGADFLQVFAEGIGRIFAAFFQIFIKFKLLGKGFSSFNVFGLALFGFRYGAGQRDNIFEIAVNLKSPNLAVVRASDPRG
jgi:hypothetical protein